MVANVARIHPFTIIQRERILPVPGRVLVKKGQQVSATDVVAETTLFPQCMILDVAKALGVPTKNSDKYIKCKEDMQVAEGDILAGPVGFAKRVLRAPKDGKIILTLDGQIFIEIANAPYEVKAGLPGVVKELMDERGVVIETCGALVQGVWGNGSIDFGLLSVVSSDAKDVLAAHQLTVSLKGAVILAGQCNDLETLNAAASLPVRGMILSSLPPELIPEAQQMPFPIIAIDGVGNIPMNSAAHKLLASNDKREVNINAEPWNHASGDRPEVVIPLPAAENMPNPHPSIDYEAGQLVKIVRAPYTGKVGKLVRIRPGMTTFQSGVNGVAGEIQLEDGVQAIVPLVNLEVLE